MKRLVHVTTTTTIAVVTAVVAAIIRQLKRSEDKLVYILLLYTRTAVVVVVDAHNEVPGTNIVGTHDDIRVHIKGVCFAIPASPSTKLGWLGLQWVRSARIVLA